jgi:hypothetical protein
MSGDYPGPVPLSEAIDSDVDSGGGVTGSVDVGTSGVEGTGVTISAAGCTAGISFFFALVRFFLTLRLAFFFAPFFVLRLTKQLHQPILARSTDNKSSMNDCRINTLSRLSKYESTRLHTPQGYDSRCVLKGASRFCRKRTVQSNLNV